MAGGIMAYNVPKLLNTGNLSYFQLANLNAASSSTSLIATTDASQTFIPLYVSIQLTAVAGLLIVASFSLGTNAAVNNILAITLLAGLTSTNLILNIPIVSVISNIAPSTPISVKVTTPATASTYVLKVSLIGFYG